MVIIGAVTTGVLLLLQVRAAVALGVLAGLLEFVPFVGPIVAAVPAIAMAFLDSPEKALWVTIAAVVIQQLESNLLMPLLMREGLDLPPILTLLAQGAMALLFGFLGVVVAVPLLAAVVVPVKMLYVRDVVGERVRVPGDDKDAPDDP
jgi:predicted PurR-regulated permease PerM